MRSGACGTARRLSRTLRGGNRSCCATSSHTHIQELCGSRILSSCCSLLFLQFFLSRFYCSQEIAIDFFQYDTVPKAHKLSISILAKTLVRFILSAFFATSIASQWCFRTFASLLEATCVPLLPPVDLYLDILGLDNHFTISTSPEPTRWRNSLLFDCRDQRHSLREIVHISISSDYPRTTVQHFLELDRFAGQEIRAVVATKQGRK